MGYVLTEEGKRYLEEGLPEKRLAKELEKGPRDIKELRTIIPDLNIALNWAKKKFKIEIKNGKCRLFVLNYDFPEEEALKLIDEGKEPEKEMLDILLKRKLIKEKKDDIFSRAEKYVGKEITNLTEELIKTGLWKKVKFKPYNIAAHGKVTPPGKKQPYAAFLDWIRLKLVSMGFKEMSGPIVETEFWNMDALYMPQDHSARDIHDAYFVKKPKYTKTLDKNILQAVKKSHETGDEESRGWNYQYDIKRAHRLILRTHGTVLSAKMLASGPEIPGKYFSIARCFRHDVIDSTHLPDFYQVEGIVVEKNLNFRYLIGLLRMFAKEFAGTDKIKLVPSYFPFTEPSVELHAYMKGKGWIELAGAGIFRKEMTKPLGIDAPVIAWGIGIDRVAMCNMGIKDIRKLFTYDLDYLRKSVIRNAYD